MHTLRVFLALAPFAFSFLRDFHRWIWWGTPALRTPEDHARRARRLVQTIVGLGPTFVKLAQVFASRADIIPEPYLTELGTLVDQVPPMPFADVARTIREQYGRDVDDVFRNFERTPIAAASLGQVHRARVTHDGADRVVAVKVLRVNVEKNVAADLHAALRILGIVERRVTHPEVRRIKSVLSEFKVRISEEMDFRLEAGYATEVRANFAGNPHVCVPEVFHEYVRQRVLVLEFVEGTRIDRLDPTRVDVSRVVAMLVELYIQMMLVDGLFHADPHPGNIMVGADGTIVLVDFGMTVRVPLETRRALMHTALAAVRKNADEVADGFMTLGLFTPDTDRATVRWLADFLITHAYARTTARERIDMLLSDRVMKTLFDSPAVLPQHLVYFARTAALLEGIGTRYDPYFQVIPVASPVIIRMRGRILKSLGESVQPELGDIAMVAGDALGRAARWVADRARELTNQRII